MSPMTNKNWIIVKQFWEMARNGAETIGVGFIGKFSENFYSLFMLDTYNWELV